MNMDQPVSRRAVVAVVVVTAVLILGLVLAGTLGSALYSGEQAAEAVEVTATAALLRGATATLTATPTATPAPLLDFTVQNLAGDPIHLSDYRGQVALVNFWATWCAPCKEEMPILDAYYQDHRESGFVLLGINVSDRPNEAAAFFDEAGYTFPILFDPPGNVLIEMGLRGLPSSIVVDAEGHRVKTWIGPLTREMLDEDVTPLLAADVFP
jgi:thiol-disulfide isomerase/thioredoxin